jgi:hypothetical protein
MAVTLSSQAATAHLRGKVEPTRAIVRPRRRRRSARRDLGFPPLWVAAVKVVVMVAVSAVTILAAVGALALITFLLTRPTPGG